MKNKNWILIAISITIFFVSPILVQYTNIIPGSKGNGDWLSFWGSYLGIIPSGLIAYAVAKVQISATKESERLQRNEEHYLKELRALYISLINLGTYRSTLSQYREIELTLKNYVTTVSFIKEYDDKLINANLKYGVPDFIKQAIITMPSDGNSKIVEIGSSLSDEIARIDFLVSCYKKETPRKDGTVGIVEYLSDLKIVNQLLDSIGKMDNFFNDLEIELVSEIKKHGRINS